MKRIYTNTKRELVELSGNEVRIYWDEREETIQTGIDEGVQTNVYSYFEYVLPADISIDNMKNELLNIDSSIDIDPILSLWESIKNTRLVFYSLFINPQQIDIFNSIIENVNNTILAPGPIYNKQNVIVYYATAGWVPQDLVNTLNESVQNSIITQKDPYTIMRELQLHT